MTENNTENGSAAAAPIYDHVAQKLVTETSRDEERQKHWYRCGKKAKNLLWDRVSPFYENSTADYFFKCGFDGVKFEEAQATLRDKIKQELEKDSTVLQTVNELAKL